MTITTKFNVGDKLFVLKDSAVLQETVVKITVEVSAFSIGKDPLITYTFDAPDGGMRNESFYRYENEIGATVEELIRAHTKNVQSQPTTT